MPKTSSIYTRVEPEVKEQAEQILSKLGIPVSNAINLFLHQVVLQKGIPFELKLQPLPRKEGALDFSRMTQEQIDAELQKGLDDFEAGRVYSSKQVRERMERHFGR